MKNTNRILALIGFLVVLTLFIGPVSADSLNITEVGLAAEGVKNYTEANSRLPGYVVVSDKNSTTGSFLNTVTKATVQVNQGVSTPVTIATVGNAPIPSGSATGNIYKTEYIDIANRIGTFITNNGVAPNYASTSIGQVRYESLVYMYAKIMYYYKNNNQLPNYVSVVNYAGVNSNGVVIDNVPPTVTNNLAPGTYNTAKNVTLTGVDSYDANPTVYYSLNNGTTWSNQVKTVTLTLNSGVTILKYYARDAAGNTGITQTATYTINTTAPATTDITNDELLSVANSVQAYIEANHQLPINVTVSGKTMSMAQFLALATASTINLNNNITTSLSLGNYTAALNSTETITTSGNLTKTAYLTLATTIKSYMDSNGRAPDYTSTSLGNMGYESEVYTFAQILKSYSVAKVLPNFITIQPWTIVSNNSTVFITMDQIKNAADTVQSYIETNHQLPNHVTIAGSTVTMPQFLKLEINYLINAKENLLQSIVLKNYNTAPNPSESITGGNLNLADYLSAANDINTFMNTNGYAPNYRATVRGYIRYESLVYIYAEIINSASKNKRLPDYIALTPWTTVTNNSTEFITMDQINTAVWTVKSYVETNHALPSSVTISGKQITMPQFLKLEITSLKNIYSGLYQSIILQSYTAPSSPSETVTSGKINYENYINAANNTYNFMVTNGQAPNYAWTSLGNMRYESLVYMYSQILNYYNVKNALPEYVTVNPWSVVSNPNTVTFDVGQIISGAETVTAYVETNHALPNNITIAGAVISMPQFLKLLTTSLHNINGTYAGQIVLSAYGPPTDTSETITGGTLNKTQYLDLARNTEYFMYGDLRAPNYRTTTLGNIRYQSLIYMFSQILSSYKANSYTLPDFITIRPWTVVSNSTTKFFTIDQITNASKTVKSHIETNHTLPANVNISETQVTMPQFLKLLTTAVANINGKLNATIVLQGYNTATSPSETVTGGSINNTSYLNYTNNIISYMDSNGRAPDYTSTSIGNMRYESLVYTYSLLLNYYSEKQKLPQNITVTPWAVVSNATTKFFTVDEIDNAAKTVQSYVETNHQLPTNVTISGTVVSMPQFLQLAATALLNIDDSRYTSIVLRNYNTASSPSETITTSANITYTDYVNFSNSIISYMYSNGRAPDYQTISTGNMRYESLVYMYSQILSSHNSTSTLPDFVTMSPWTVVSNSSTVFITTDQIKNASEIIKAYIDTNHALPNNVTIAGRQITMAQFLKLAVTSAINIESYLSTSVILSNVGGPTNSTENITCGNIINDEFVDMGKKILSYMNFNGTAPNNVADTSLGNTMGYESLVYMYAQFMTSYNSTAYAPEQVAVIPWMARSNPNGTFNFRTQEIFSSIQAAIDDNDTVSGDTLWLQKITYSENIIINKRIVIRPIHGVNVTIQALNPNLPVLTITFSGNGTTIQDLIIKGATGNAGIYINNSMENSIFGNNITGNSNGIYLYNSTENLISGNNILNNTLNGIFINTGSDNEISSNKVNSNGSTGINIQNSNSNRVFSNVLSCNMDGIHLTNSSADVHLNRIAGNTRYGLYNEGNGTVNATNNWWGSNNPLVSSVSPSDIYIAGGNVTYNPWLVLSLISSTDRSDRNGTTYKYIITADLTHNNQGKDTSSDGNVPDNIPINFISTIGTINNTGSTKKGKAELILNSTAIGTANVSITLDNQTVLRAVNITSVNVLGVYNTRTQENFTTIQAAIDDSDTLNGDIITLADGTYTENIVVNKKITINPVNGANVNIKAKKEDRSVFVINNDGSGSTIQGLNIISSSDSYGISLSHAFNSNIINNTICNGNRGIYLYVSGNNTLAGNIIRNGYYGIVLYNSTNNNLTQNTIKDNENGLYLFNSNFNLIKWNNLSDNYYGSYFYHSSNNNITNNNVTGNWVGVYLYDTNNNRITGNTFTDNGAGITYHNSIGTFISGNNFTSNWLADVSVIEDGEMVIATTIYTCGPAALATILKKLGIFTTEGEIAKLAGTDETGTSLYGLKTAAISKGVTAVGARLSIDQLQPNYLVVLNIDGTKHFEIVRNITNTTVYLFDPNLGDIEMTRSKFNELYIGVAMIFNGTAPANATLLTDDEMRNIKAMWHIAKIEHSYWIPGYWYPTLGWVTRSFSYPTIRLRWVPGYYLWGWIPMPGHFEPYIAWKRASINIPTMVWKYQPPRKVTYYTYKLVSDENDPLNGVLSSTKEYFRGFPAPVPDSIEAGDSVRETIRANLPGFIIGYSLETSIWMIENHPEDCTLIFFDPTFSWCK